MVKDLGLSFLMLELIEGTQAMVDLPTNFGSVIVSVMLTSIFVPMILSSVHLMNSAEIIDNIMKSSSKLKRFLKMGMFFLMSPFHPIILDTLSHKKLEEARTLAEQYNIQATQKMEQYRTLKRQLVTFIKIELGIFFYNMFALLCIVMLKPVSCLVVIHLYLHFYLSTLFFQELRSSSR